MARRYLRPPWFVRNVANRLVTLFGNPVLEVAGGLGPAAGIDAVTVRWPDGVEERFGSLEIDKLHVLRQGSGGA